MVVLQGQKGLHTGWGNPTLLATHPVSVAVPSAWGVSGNWTWIFTTSAFECLRKARRPYPMRHMQPLRNVCSFIIYQWGLAEAHLENVIMGTVWSPFANGGCRSQLLPPTFSPRRPVPRVRSALGVVTYRSRRTSRWKVQGTCRWIWIWFCAVCRYLHFCKGLACTVKMLSMRKTQNSFVALLNTIQPFARPIETGRAPT